MGTPHRSFQMKKNGLLNFIVIVQARMSSNVLDYQFWSLDQIQFKKSTINVGRSEFGSGRDRGRHRLTFDFEPSLAGQKSNITA